MDHNLAQKAICAAINGRWEEALNLNKEIIKTDSENVDALNRLARAYSELGILSKAKSTAKKVIKIDQHNSIAQKCLEKWKGLKKGETLKSGQTFGSSFIEEPGKTKLISLLHTGAQKVLAKLDAGDEVSLSPYGHRISVTSIDGSYIGRLPDDVSAKLKKLIHLGNEYTVLVKSIEGKNVKVFIKETKCAPKATDIPSFPTEKINYVSFTPPELVHKKDVIKATDESEE